MPKLTIVRKMYLTCDKPSWTWKNLLHLDNSVAVYYSRQPLNRTATSVKSQQQIHGWFCNKASSVVLCANKFKSLHIMQETEFGVRGKGEGFTSVEFRPDCSGEAGRSPWRMFVFQYNQTSTQINMNHVLN